MTNETPSVNGNGNGALVPLAGVPRGTVGTDFLTFAVGGGANVQDQASYSTDAQRPTGALPGLARANFNNKATRQGTFVAHSLCLWISQQIEEYIADDGDDIAWIGNWSQALSAFVGALIPPGPDLGQYLPLAGGTMVGHIRFQPGISTILANNTWYYSRDTGGTNRGLLLLGNNNDIYINDGSAARVRINGQPVIGNNQYWSGTDTGGTIRPVVGLLSDNAVHLGNSLGPVFLDCSTGNSVWTNGNVVIPNNTWFYARDAGTTPRALMGLNGASQLVIGSGITTSTEIYAGSGQPINLHNNVVALATFQSNGYAYINGGGRAYIPGGNDPWQIYADNGRYARTYYTVAGTRSWTLGILNSGVWALADESAQAVRFQVDLAGTGLFYNNLQVNGALNVGGGTTLGALTTGALTVNGGANVYNGLVVQSGAFTANGAGTIGGGLTIFNGFNCASGNGAFAGTLQVNSTFVCLGSAQINGGLTLYNGLNVASGNASFAGSVTAANITATNNLQVNNYAQVNAGMAVYSGLTVASGTLTAQGALTVAGGVNLNNMTHVYQLQVGGTSYMYDNGGNWIYFPGHFQTGGQMQCAYLYSNGDVRAAQGVYGLGMTAGVLGYQSDGNVWLRGRDAGGSASQVQFTPPAGQGGRPYNIYPVNDWLYFAESAGSPPNPTANWFAVFSGGIGVLSGGQGYKPGGGLWGDISEARFKRDIVDYERGLDAILALRPRSFEFTHDLSGETLLESRRFHGLVAEEVEDVMPELMGQLQRMNSDGEVETVKTVDATAVIWALVNSVKTLAAEIEALKGGRA